MAGPLYGLQRLKNARMPGLTKSVVDVGVWISSLYFTPKSVPLWDPIMGLDHLLLQCTEGDGRGETAAASWSA